MLMHTFGLTSCTLTFLLCIQRSGKGLDTAANVASAAQDSLQYGPKPDQLIPKLAQDTDATEGQVYRPPKLNPVTMDDDPDKDYGKKERRRQQHAARKAGRSEFMQALASELEGAPEEVSHADASLSSSFGRLRC